VKGKQNVIRLSQTSVSIAEVLRSSNETIRKESAVFSSKRPIDIKSEFSDFLKQQLSLSTADETTLAWCSPKSVLVPGQIFSVDNISSYLDFVFGDCSDEPSDYNRLTELEMVNVYTIPDWVKSAAILNIPTILIQQDVSFLLRGLFQGATFKPQGFVLIYDAYFLFCLVKHNQLVFLNHFEFQTEEDVLYYISYTLQQLNWMQEKMEIHVMAGFDEVSELVDKVLNFQREKNLFPSMQWINSSDLLTLFALKCV
jgi:hypothetical protein